MTFLVVFVVFSVIIFALLPRAGVVEKIRLLTKTQQEGGKKIFRGQVLFGNY